MDIIAVILKNNTQDKKANSLVVLLQPLINLMIVNEDI